MSLLSIYINNETMILIDLDKIFNQKVFKISDFFKEAEEIEFEELKDEKNCI